VVRNLNLAARCEAEFDRIDTAAPTKEAKMHQANPLTWPAIPPPDRPALCSTPSDPHTGKQKRKSLQDAQGAGEFAKTELIPQAAAQHAAHRENLASRTRLGHSE